MRNLRPSFVLVCAIILCFSGCRHRVDTEPVLKPPGLFDKGTDFSQAKQLPLKPYRQDGVLYKPTVPIRRHQNLVASWYGKQFHGKPTASGETFDVYRYSAAHKTWPIPSFARVTNKANGKSLIVRINDRGPFVKGRDIDLSWSAARKLDFIKQGVADVEVHWLGTQPPNLLARLW